MIKDLLRRYKEGVHPCMLLFLIQLYYDPTIIAYYNGDHISTQVDELHLIDMKHGWSSDSIIESFTELNQVEKDLLKTYFEWVHLQQ